MFAANKKVSTRQLNRIIITENTALALLMGGYLAGELGSLSYIWLFILGLVLSMAYIRAALKISEKYADKLLRSKIFNIIACIRFLAMACVGIYIFYRMAVVLLLRETAGLIIIAGITALSLYVASRHYEERGRIHQILGVFVILLILIILITATFKIDLKEALYDLSQGFKLPGKSGFLIWLSMFLMTNYFEKLIIVSPHYYNSYGKRIALLKAPVIMWIGALWVYILNVNIFGKGANLYKLMDIGGIPGGFLNRQETIMAVFLVISLTSYVSGMFYYIRQCIKNIFIRYTDKPRIVTRRIVSVLAVIAVFLGSVMLGIRTDGIEAMSGDKVIGGKEIEKWDFVMSMIISGGESPEVVLELANTASEDFESIYVSYSYEENEGENTEENKLLDIINKRHMEAGNNEFDFSHIKGIVLYDMSEAERSRIVAEFKQNKEISGNVSVYKATRDTYPKLLSDITENEDGENIRLGQMLENILENSDGNGENMLYKIR